MSKCIISVLTSVMIGGAVFAEGQPKPKMTSAEARAKMELSMMKRFGGRIRQPNSEKGSVVLVNRQKIVKTEAIDAFIAEWSKRYRVTIKTSEADVKSAKGTVVIRLEESDREEALILAPENFWVSVNVRALAKDNPPPAILKLRFEKELKRAYAFVNGGTCGGEPGGLCGTVSSLSDLDAIPARLYTPDIEVRLLNNQPSVGVEPYRIAKYIEACQEGWAPQPTNEFQKAIWDKVREVPAKPIKVEFDPKKGE